MLHGSAAGSRYSGPTALLTQVWDYVGDTHGQIVPLTLSLLCLRPITFLYQVWDYVGDNYVHRLIQSKTGGKLVEVPSPGPPRRPGHGRRRRGRHSCSSTGGRASSHGNACRPPPGFEGAQGGGTGSGSDYEGSSAEEEDEEGGAGDEELKEAMLASKLDHIAAGECTLCAAACARPSSCAG